MRSFFVAAALLAVGSSTALADVVDYEVSAYAPATVKAAGNGLIFVDLANPEPGSTHSFTLTMWAREGQGTAKYPSPSIPLRVKHQAGALDVHLSESAVSFDARGEGRSITVSVTVPAEGLGGVAAQVKIEADTGGIQHFGGGHGIMIRAASAEVTPFTIESWVSDSSFVPLAAYGDQFLVNTKGKTLDVAATNPGSFYFNVLITTAVDIDRLTLGASIPADFGPKGANATHLYVGEVDVAAPESSAGTALRQLLEGITLTDLPADSTVFLTIHVHYGLKRLPSEGYLPRDYDFRAAAVAEIGAAEFGASSAATATGVRKR